MEYSSDPRWPESAADGRIGIVVSSFNDYVTDGLLTGARTALLAGGVPEGRIDVVRVPGALELPLSALAWKVSVANPLAVLALGCVIRGETRHFEIVADTSCRQLADLALEWQLPVLNGVLACETINQAIARSAPDDNTNKGTECARTALHMISLLSCLRAQR